MVTISRWHLERVVENVEVPEGHIVCPKCKGTAEIRVRWSGVGHTENDWQRCSTCLGEGYVDEEHWKRWLEVTKKIKENSKN